MPGDVKRVNLEFTAKRFSVFVQSALPLSSLVGKPRIRARL